MNPRTLTVLIVRLSMAIVSASPCLDAQLTLLTAGEAKELVELIPAVEAARKDGQCPALSLFPLMYGGRLFSIQARGICRHPGNFESLLIGNYTVNRQTGSITLDASSTTISTPTIQKRAKVLVTMARGRLLSIAESRCLALEAAATDFVSGTDKYLVSLREIRADEGEWRGFQIEGRISTKRAVVARLYSVNVATGDVWNQQTGSEVVSAGLAAIRAKLIAVRNPPMLSVEDVLGVALHLPVVSSRLADGCSEVEATESNAAAHEVYIVIRKTCGQNLDDAEVAASINIVTGAVSDPRTHMPIRSELADKAAQELLLRAKEVLQIQQADLGTLCHDNR